MNKLNSMEDLYKEQIQDLYSAESQILKAMPKMIDCAKDSELKKAFKNHTQETEQQVKRLEEILKELKEKPGEHKCKAMEGLLKEGDDLIKQDGKANPEVLDAALISAAQRIEHYEIAGYGTAATYAKILGFENHVQLLKQTLSEEKETDHKLTALAERKINQKALV